MSESRSITKMAGLLKYFTRENLPTSHDTGLGDVIMKEANAAVEKVLVQERRGAEGRKRKYNQDE